MVAQEKICPDGTPDQNVFDIMQGVSINIFLKTGKKKNNEFGKLFHSEIYGTRELKYESLFNTTHKNINWEELILSKPNLFFVPKVFENSILYNNGFNVIDLFNIYGSGFKTERDSITIHFNKGSLLKTVNDFKNLNEDTIRHKYDLGNEKMLETGVY